MVYVYENGKLCLTICGYKEKERAELYIKKEGNKNNKYEILNERRVYEIN